MIKWIEFLQNDTGHNSLGRLLPACCFIFSTIEMYRLHSEGAFTLYITVFAGYGLGSKAIGSKGTKNANSNNN